jgi:hypothetical protein
VRERSEHRGLDLSWENLYDKFDDICYVMLALVLAIPTGSCIFWCARHKDGVERVATWGVSCSHFFGERTHAFWFLLIYWLLIFVLATRALIQLGAVKDFREFLVKLYVDYLIAGIFLIMIVELWFELRKVFNRALEWCSEQFAKFRDSLRKVRSRMDAQAKSVMDSLSPDGMKNALQKAEDFVVAHSPKMKACC